MEGLDCPNDIGAEAEAGEQSPTAEDEIIRVFEVGFCFPKEAAEAGGKLRDCGNLVFLGGLFRIRAEDDDFGLGFDFAEEFE